MRVVKIVTATLVLGLGAVSASATTPATVMPTQSVKVSLPSDYDDVAQVIGSGTSWLVVGNIEKNTIVDSALFPNEVTMGGSDGYLALLDPALHLVWSHRFGTSNDDVATAIARDQDGIIWTVGVTTKEQPTTTPTPSATSTTMPMPTLNPDGVVPVVPFSASEVADQLVISSWNNAGQLLTQNLLAIAPGVALDPSAAVVGKSGIYVVGTGVDAAAGTSRGFYLLVSKDGSIGPVHWLGSKAVILRTAAVLSNGSLMVAGSIAETLKGRPAIGLVDAFIAVVNPITAAVLRTQRSGNISATRSWESVSVDRLGNALAVGSSLGSKSEVVATSFSPSGVVKFSLRLAKPLGTQVAMPAPTGAFAAIAVATTHPGKSSTDAYLAPIDVNGRLLSPTYLVGRAGNGLLAAAAGKGRLLISSNQGAVTLALFAPRSGK